MFLLDSYQIHRTLGTDAGSRVVLHHGIDICLDGYGFSRKYLELKAHTLEKSVVADTQGHLLSYIALPSHLFSPRARDWSVRRHTKNRAQHVVALDRPILRHDGKFVMIPGGRHPHDRGSMGWGKWRGCLPITANHSSHYQPLLATISHAWQKCYAYLPSKLLQK